MITIELKTMPPAVNATYRRGASSFYKSNEAKDAQEAIRWEMRSQYRGKPLKGEVILDIQFFWPDKRRHDIDSCLKSLLDCGNDLLYGDDSQIQELVVSKTVRKGKSGVSLNVIPLDA